MDNSADRSDLPTETEEAQMSAYLVRAYEQGKSWVGGRSVHERVNNECCPDFSCCMPQLFVVDRLERMRHFNAWCQSHGFSQLMDG